MSNFVLNGDSSGSLTLQAPSVAGSTVATFQAVTGNVQVDGGPVSDNQGNVRSTPINSQTTAYTLVATDNGKTISITTGGVTVPAAIFSAGNIISIYNNSASAQTITQGTSATMTLAGTVTTGNRTLAANGIATVLCVASNTFVISGAGLS